MDMVKTGSFLAQLRKERGLTQEQLGNELGVSNKTVSRWENGNYLPPVEMLQALSAFYDISINELLSGQRLAPADYREQAEENIKTALDNSAFTLKEKMDYFKKKWQKDHITSAVLGVLVFAGAYVYALTRSVYRSELMFLTWILMLGFLILRYNMMMAYVEGKAFDVPDLTAAEAETAHKQFLFIRRLRMTAMVLLAVSAVVAADLGYNYFSALVPELNDGLTIRGIFAGIVFGDDHWTLARFFRGFGTAMQFTAWLAAGNLILACVERKLQK